MILNHLRDPLLPSGGPWRHHHTEAGQGSAEFRNRFAYLRTGPPQCFLRQLPGPPCFGAHSKASEGMSEARVRWETQHKNKG